MALNAILSCFTICFKELNKPSPNEQQNQYQQNQNQNQNQNQYPPLVNQQQAYPPTQPPHHNQQQQQQQGQAQGQSWSQVAGGGHGHGQGQGHKPNHQQQHHNNNNQHQNNNQHFQTNLNDLAADYYNSSPSPPSNGYGSSPPPPQSGNWTQAQAPAQAQHGGHIPSGGIVGPYHPGHQNQDQINATNQHYVDLRNRARKAGDEAHRCFASSQQAYQSGDGAAAHDLSVEGKQHQAEQDRLDDEASEWIFRENNKASPPGTIDLHGLYVKEAIERTENAIAQAQRDGTDELRVIVGKGIHSQGGVGKIKPAVTDLMRKYNLSAHIDPHNTGVLIVDLQGRESGPRSRDAGGLVDEMDRDQGCTIM